MTEFWNSVVTVLLAIIGVAFLAVIVSKQANTPAVLQAGSQAFSGALGTALSPITANIGSAGQLPSLTQGAGYIV